MPAPDFTDKYNTKLSPEQEAQFQAQYPNNKDVADYDLRGAFAAGATKAANGHLPDTYKKPNHPTFSSESQYNGVDGYTGGKWSKHGDAWQFEASNTNTKMRSPEELQQYFATTEKGNALVLPFHGGPDDGPGIAPQRKIAPGQQEYQKLLSGGFSADEANAWRGEQTQKLMGAGFKQPEIEAYWGEGEASPHQIDQMHAANPGIHEATNPLEMLEAGMQMSVAGLLVRGKMPDTVEPHDAGLLAKVLGAVGQTVGDIPAIVPGFIGGAAAGAGGGGTVGSALPVVGTAAGAAAGTVVGAGAGSAALPQAMREIIMGYFRRGEVHTWKDAYAMATQSLWNTAKAGLTGAIAAPVGGVAGSKVLSATAKPFLATGANMTTQAVTATAVGGALEGHVPNADDFVAGAAVMLGFHGAGKVVGAMGGQRFVPNEASRRVESNLQQVYRRLGIPPWEAAQKARTDPALRQEILAQDVHGEAVHPNFTKSAPDEPPLPPKKPVFGGAPKPANESAAAPIDDILLKVKGLEASGDQAISPAGAIGRFQIMPGTARQYGFDPAKLGDVQYNEHAARTILSDLYRRFRGDEDAVLTAYNAGPGRAAKLLTAGPGTRLEATKGKHGWQYDRVDAPRSEAGLPMETQEYLARGRAAGGGGEGGKPPGGGSGGGGNEPPKQIAGPEGDADPMKLDTEQRVSRFLDKVGKPPEPPGPFNLSTMYRQFVSELGPARDIDKLLENEGLLDRSKDIGIEDMMRQTYGSSMRAGYFLKEGVLDPITLTKKSDLSFMSIMKDIHAMKGSVDEFNTYRASLRTIEKADQGIETGVMSLDEAKANAADPNLKRYADVNTKLQAWKDGSLEYGRDSGLFSQEQVDRMRAANTSHISFRRVMDNVQPSGGKRGFKARDPLKRMEGSDRKIIDPTMADMDNMVQIVRMADRNRAIGSVIGAIEAKGKLADLGLTKIEGPLPPTMAEPGSDVFKPYGETGEGFEPFLAQRGTRKGLADNQFLYFRNGKAELWEATDPLLAQLMRGADSTQEANAVISVATAMANIQRKGIVSTPDFPLRNTMRDQITAFIADPHSPPPFVTWMRGAMHVWKMDKEYWDWVAKGGAGTALADMETNYIQRDINRLMDTETGTYGKMWNTVRHPIEAATLIAERLDAITRVGYKLHLEGKGIDSFKAATLSRKAALDFAERGTAAISQGMAKITPFFRPNVLGLKQYGEALIEKPGATVFKAMAAITMPSLALYALNYLQDEYGDLPEGQKYKELPRWQRDTMLVFPSVGGIRLRLPVPQILNVAFGGLPVRFLDHWVQHDKHAFEGWANSFLAQFVPPLIPTVGLPVMEAITNHSFFAGKPLVPTSMEKATGDMQYTDATTEPAKALARILGPHQHDIADISPIVVDNFVRQWTGTLGYQAMKAVGATMKTSAPWQIGDIPFVGSFFVRNPTMSAYSIQNFYEGMERLEAAQANVRLALKKDEMDVFQQDAGKARIYQRLSLMKQAINMQRSVLDAINTNEKMTREEKQQNTDRIVGDMIMVASTGDKLIQGLK
jgi:hypothetical protein